MSGFRLVPLKTARKILEFHGVPIPEGAVPGTLIFEASGIKSRGNEPISDRLRYEIHSHLKWDAEATKQSGENENQLVARMSERGR